MKKLDLNLKQITILIGPNNSGKSSVLQALTVFKQSVYSAGLVFQGNLLRLGQFLDVVHGHMDDLQVRIGIGGAVVWNKPLSPLFPIVREIGVFLSASQSSQMLERVDGGLEFNQQGFEWHQDLRLPRKDRFETTTDGITWGVHNVNQVGFPSLSIFGAVGEKQNLSQQFQLTLQKVGMVLGQLFNDVVLVPTLRGQDELGLDLVDNLPNDFLDAAGHKSEEMKTLGVLAMQRTLEDKVSAWHERITGSKVHIAIMPQKKVTLEATKETLTTNIMNEGFGSNQLAYLLIPLAAARRGSTIGIEEPEIHLHPGAQMVLADILVEEAQTQKKNLIITTHSDFFVAYLLTLVAAGKIPKDGLAIYNFEYKDSETTATLLKIDEKGQVEGGLPSFFRANVELMKQYTNAIIRQKG